MDPTATPRLFARYNRWMNERLYASCEQLPDADRRRDLGAFFRSVHGTLNHLLIVDRLWLGRLHAPEHGRALDAEGREIPMSSLAQELYADFAMLRRERAATDDAILAFADALTAERMAAPLRFVALKDGREWRMPTWVAVAQLFNHQTHHRGQLTTLLHQLGIDFGVTDVPALPDVASL
jgi:uncharacterized damage-inducible protein DinB